MPVNRGRAPTGSGRTSSHMKKTAARVGGGVGGSWVVVVTPAEFWVDGARRSSLTQPWGSASAAAGAGAAASTGAGVAGRSARILASISSSLRASAAVISSTER